jgi:hypothetical protein
MQGDHRARARPARALERLGGQVPAAVVVQAIRCGADRLQLRELGEQRIARRRHQHVVARVTQQLEQERIGLAGAGREHDAFCRHRDALLGHERARRLTRRAQPERLGPIPCGPGVCERGQRAGWNGQLGARRIRLGQIEQRLPSTHRRGTRLL